jgi:hypothetical protein
MEQSLSWGANSHWINQEICNILWNPKGHYRFHNNPSLVPNLSQMNPMHKFPLYFPESLPLMSSHQCVALPSGLFPSGFTAQTLYAFLISPMHATCPTHLILLYLITLTIYGEVYKLRSFSLCSLHQSSYFVHVFSSAPCSQTPSIPDVVLN